MVSVQGWLVVRETEGEAAAEAALLRAGQRGDRAALDQLFLEHQHPLFTLCYGILGRVEDAEDAVQETFLRALRGLAAFRGDSRFRSWLFRIALNVCLRWKATRRDTELLDPEHAAGSDASPEAIAIAHLRLTEALSGLPPHHRAILLLKEREGWSAAEIAAALGWNQKRVYNELFKARRDSVLPRASTTGLPGSAVRKRHGALPDGLRSSSCPRCQPGPMPPCGDHRLPCDSPCREGRETPPGVCGLSEKKYRSPR